jgi:hypothetical protein
MDANAKSIRQEIKSGQAEMTSTIAAFKEKMDALITNIKNDRKETTACHAEMEATKTEPDQGTMQSMDEHQEIPKENSVVKPIKGREKQHRDRKPAAG